MIEIEIDSNLKDIPPRDYTNCNIDTIDIHEINYNYFIENYLLKNMPCLVKNVSTTWECSQRWIKGNQINYNYIKRTYGDIDASVANCNEMYFNAHSIYNMTVSEYMDYLKDEKRDKILYLKDWHLRKLRPNDTFYNVPYIFGSDWLNEYAEDLQEDDFMFVYIGPTKSWTPVHADVYSSYSWSVNIFGMKKWILLPPSEEEKLKDPLGNLPLPINPEQLENVKYFSISQKPGDALFVPSGWYHEVTNMLDTISINHNFINACNIEIVWKSLQDNLLSIEKEIADLKETPEFNAHCQLMLKSMFGMDFIGFLHFIRHIVSKRLNQLDNGYFAWNNFCLGIKHIMFDLHTLLKVINSIQKHPLVLNNCIDPNEVDAMINLKKSTIEKIEKTGVQL